MRYADTEFDSFSLREPDKPQSIFRTKQEEIANNVWLICSPIILALGTIGNILAIVVLSRKQMRWKTSSFPLRILALVDLMMLYLGLLRQLVRTSTQVDIRHLSQLGCKLHLVLLYTAKHFSAWILVFLAVERFIVVWFPFRSRTLCKRRNEVVGLVIIGICLLAINSHFFLTYGETLRISNSRNRTKRETCYYKEEFKGFFQIWPLVDALISTYVPFLIMLMCNALVISRILYRRFQRKKVMSVSVRREHFGMTSMTCMLLTTTFTFLVLTTPVSLYLMGQISWWKEERKRNNNFVIFWAIAQQLMYLNNAINFVLYCVSNQQFRRELYFIFQSYCKPRIRQGNQISNLSTVG